MRNKFVFLPALALMVLSGFVFSAQAQEWERVDKQKEKQARKQTTVRTIQGGNGIIVTSSDEVIVRPAIRANVRPVVRPVVPRPPVAVVRPNVQVYRSNNYPSYSRSVPATYTYRTYESVGNYENGRAFGSNDVAQVARLNGYRDGLREGAADARDGDAYNPFGEHAYKDGATGYISKYGNRSAYQQIYRQSFVKGYKESFDRYLGGPFRRDW